MSDEKVTVQISKKTFEFLKELGETVATQDNRGTAQPYFLVIKTKKWRICVEEYSHGETRKTRYDGEFEAEFENLEEYTSYVNANGYELTGAMIAERWGDLTEHTLEEYEEEGNVFFTHKAFDDHVVLNGHNLGRRGEYYTYLKYAERNPQLTHLFKAFAEFREAKEI